MTLETFMARAQTLGMEARRVTDMAACRAVVAEIVGHGPALIDEISGLEGLGVAPPEDPWDAAIGVSEAFSAAAEAGAVALVQAAGAPRRTSLLPPNHVVVVRAERTPLSSWLDCARSPPDSCSPPESGPGR